MARDPKAHAKTIFLVATSSILSVLAAEFVVRLGLPSPGFIQRTELPGLLIPHPTRSYAYAPNYRGEVRTKDYRIRIDTNSLGLRDDPIPPDAHVDILAAGDSFTVGFGVEADEAWPSRLESQLNAGSGTPGAFRVVNAGVSGYNVTQIRLLIDELLSLNPKLVVLGLYPSRYWRLENPYVYFGGDAVLSHTVGQLRVVDGGIVKSPIVRPGLKELYFWLAQHFHFGAYMLEAVQAARSRLDRSGVPTSPDRESVGSARETLKPLLDELGSMDRMLVDRGVLLVVLLVNHQETDGTFAELEKEYNAVVRDYCLDRKIAFFDLLPVLELAASGMPSFRIGDDHHWSAGARTGGHAARRISEETERARPGERRLGRDWRAPTPCDSRRPSWV